ncbi:hypothetical protein GALL_101850 [mine drainage metagenome]|uniref:Lipocalin-like domain-containing protein n=1 Tax=mine drainage metagenome TaxID=410659 RepID=A0A1J5T101_9ZZZZ
MKKINPVAIIIAATIITFTSCEWFTHSNKKTFSIIGNWKVDSVYKNGFLPDSIQRLIAATNFKEKRGEVYKFNADSTFNRLSLKDSTVEKYYLKDSTLFFRELNNYIPYAFSIKNDSTFSFINKDSVVFVLKKQ